MIWPDPTHQPTHPHTHPPNYTPTHDWRSLHRFQIFKQNWNISISSSTIEFWLIPGAPLGGGGGWMGVGGGGGERVYSTHVHTHTHACTYDIIRNFQVFPNGGGHLHEIIMFTTCACVCMHVCVCAHVWGHPQPLPTPIHLPPTPRATGSPKHQNSISLELIKIIWFCLKILYLWTFLITPHPPALPPQSQGNWNWKNYNNSWTNRDNSILFEDLWPLNPPAHI